MADDRRFELDELIVRPGTYFNPHTEVLIIVDDSSSMDSELFDENHEGADWVLVTDELPVDEPQRDELLEEFQATWHGGEGRRPPALADADADDAPDPEPDPGHGPEADLTDED